MSYDGYFYLPKNGGGAGASPMQIGLLSSFYGAVQLISGPFMGLLSDRFGRKIVMLLSYMGAMVGYLLLGFSSSLQMVVVSRIITGLLKHSQNATKAYVADHTTPGNRAVELGRMATASGLGIMVGPTVGGFLFKVGGYALPGSLAASLYLINIAIVAGLLPPDKVLHPNRMPEEGKGFLMPWHGHLPRVSMLARPQIAALFSVRLFLGLAVQTFRQGFALLVFYRFNFSVRDNGLLISYQGALSSLVQGFAIKPLVNYFDEGTLLFRGMLLLGGSFIACSWSPTIPILVVMLTPNAFSSGVLRTTFTALLTSVVPSSEVGQILGLSDAAMSACRVMGPALAGALASWWGPGIPGTVSGFLAFAAAMLLYATGCVSSHRAHPLPTNRSDANVGTEDERPLLGELHDDVTGASPSNKKQSFEVVVQPDAPVSRQTGGGGRLENGANGFSMQYRRNSSRKKLQQGFDSDGMESTRMNLLSSRSLQGQA